MQAKEEASRGNARPETVPESDHVPANIERSPIGQADEAAEFAARCVLLRAAVLQKLVEEAEIGSIEALDRLTPAFAALSCTCCRLMLRDWQRLDRKIREQKLRDWRRR